MARGTLLGFHGWTCVLVEGARILPGKDKALILPPGATPNGKPHRNEGLSCNGSHIFRCTLSNANPIRQLPFGEDIQNQTMPAKKALVRRTRRKDAPGQRPVSILFAGKKCKTALGKSWQIMA
jgi:hypothetical protein